MALSWYTQHNKLMTVRDLLQIQEWHCTGKSGCTCSGSQVSRFADRTFDRCTPMDLQHGDSKVRALRCCEPAADLRPVACLPALIGAVEEPRPGCGGRGGRRNAAILFTAGSSVGR